MDLKDIQENYERMSDSEIVRIATKSAYGLRPEVFGIIEKEIRKRNLDPNILKGAIAQNMEYSILEIEKYSNLLRNLPCPFCGSDSNKLNGTACHVVKGFLLFSTHSTEHVIACPDCLDKKNNDAIFTTAALGLWSHTGIIYVPIYIYRNLKSKRQNRLDYANDVLLFFTSANIGEIETYKDSILKLKEIISSK